MCQDNLCHGSKHIDFCVLFRFEIWHAFKEASLEAGEDGGGHSFEGWGLIELQALLRGHPFKGGGAN